MCDTEEKHGKICTRCMPHATKTAKNATQKKNEHKNRH